MRPIPTIAAAQYGVFTAQQAYDVEWTYHDLARRVEDDSLIRLRRSAFTQPPDELNEYERKRWLIGRAGVAAALRIPNATVSHLSAAAVRDLPLLETPALPCVTLRPPLRTRPADLHVHRQPLEPHHLDAMSLVPITSITRTCLDVTREVGLLAGLVTAEAALHRELMTKDEFVAAYHELRGRAGLTDGDLVVTLADGLSESPLETVSRFALRHMKVQPEQQVDVFDLNGVFVGRVDFLWREAGLVGEADGLEKYTLPSDPASKQSENNRIAREKTRQALLARCGLVVTRWGWNEARRRDQLQTQVENELRQATQLRSAGYRVRATFRCAAQIPKIAA